VMCGEILEGLYFLIKRKNQFKFVILKSYHMVPRTISPVSSNLYFLPSSSTMFGRIPSFLQASNQCPKCFQLFTKDHRCHEVWFTCTICRASLHKKEKKVRLSGSIYTRLLSKKYYRLINSLICHQCACNIVKEMKK